MKTAYKFLIIGFLAFSSCESPDDFLDVIPTGLVIPNTLEDFDKMMQDYAILRSVALNIRYMDPDVYHNQASFNTIEGNEIYENAYTWQHDLTNVSRDNDYIQFYSYIHVMNQILQEVDEAPAGNINPSARNIIKADALGQRAFQLFLAVNQYAHHYDPANPDVPGIPMPLKIDLQAFLGKTPVMDVYNQIVSDLNEAISLYPPTYQEVNTTANFRPGRASIHALLAEAYLFMGDFENAKIHSDMALSLYDFLYDYTTLDFKNPDNLWSGYDGVAASDWLYGTLNREVLWHRYNFWSFNSPIHLYSPDLEALYDKENDSRWYLFSAPTSSFGVDVSPNYIYMFAFAERCIGMSVPRLMLTNAEAKVRSGDGAGAIAVLNELLAKRHYTFSPLQHSDDATTLQIVKNERRKELAGTSVNLFDQKRYHVYGDAVPTFTRTHPNTNATYTLAPGDDGYVVNIPLAVRNINPNLN